MFVKLSDYLKFAWTVNRTTVIFSKMDTTMPTPTTNDDYMAINPTVRWFFLAVGLGVFLSGVIGNLFLMLVLATQRSLWQVHNIFIANLAVADLFVVTSGLPFMLLDLLWEKNPLQDEPDVCSAFGFTLCMSFSVSLLSMLSISFNRYVKVCRTNLFHKLFSVKRTFAFCATLWMFAGTVNTIMALADQLHGYHNVSHICTLRGQGHRKFGSIVMSVHLIVPVILIGCCNFSIFRKWRGSRATLRKNRRGRGRRSNTKLRLACDFEQNSKTRSRNIIINIAINTNSITDVVTETATTVPRPATPWPVRKVPDPPPNVKPKTRKIKAAKSIYPDLFASDFGKAGAGVAPVNSMAGLPSFVRFNDPAAHIDDPTVHFSDHAVHFNDPTADFNDHTADFNDHTVHFSDTAADFNDPAVHFNGSTAYFNATEAEFNAPRAHFNDPPGRYSDPREVDVGDDIRPDCDSVTRSTAVVAAAKNAPRTRTSPCKSPRSKASHESAVVRSLVAISICVTLFCTPLAICVLVDLAENVPSDVMVAACMMLFVNCTVNWIIYGVMNTSFRKAYVRTLRLCIKRKPVSYPFF